jgi:hypothetical protein
MTHELPQLLPHCEHKHFCAPCRELELGRSFRAGVLDRQGIDGVDVDFICPKGKRWSHELPTIKQSLQVAPGPVQLTVSVPRKKGVGDHLHQLIVQKYGISPCNKCLEVMDEMNALGPDGCNRDRERLVQGMWDRRENLSGWRKIAAKLPGSELLAKMELNAMLAQAIRRVNSA